MHHQLVKGTDVASSSSSPYVLEEIKAEDFSSGQGLNVSVNSPQDTRPIVVIDLEGLFTYSVNAIPYQSICCFL
jgi:hypothetical protein